MLELLQPLGRDLPAEGAGGHLPLPNSVATLVEFDASGGFFTAGVILRRRLRGAAGGRIGGGFWLVATHTTFLGNA
jgi:hypothetical protein